MAEYLTADQALDRGYRWIRCGWNHGQNVPIYGSLRMLRSFCVVPILVSTLDEASLFMEGNDGVADFTPILQRFFQHASGVGK